MSGFDMIFILSVSLAHLMHPAEDKELYFFVQSDRSNFNSTGGHPDLL
jgi:hypothetical protein